MAVRSGTSVVLAAVVAGVLGAAAGWMFGRQSVIPPAPIPSRFQNPLADARRGENLVLVRAGSRIDYRILDTAPDSVLILEETVSDAQTTRREFRVAKNYFGFFVFIEGDIDPVSAETSVRELVVQDMEAASLFLPSLGRDVPCWKIRMAHKLHGDLTYWVSNELPVHGVLRVESARGVVAEIESFGGAR